MRLAKNLGAFDRFHKRIKRSDVHAPHHEKFKYKLPSRGHGKPPLFLPPGSNFYELKVTIYDSTWGSKIVQPELVPNKVGLCLRTRAFFCLIFGRAQRAFFFFLSIIPTVSSLKLAALYYTCAVQ